jgi:hypothetical protein
MESHARQSGFLPLGTLEKTLLISIIPVIYGKGEGAD